MLKEIRESRDEKSMNSCLGSGSQGEIRTSLSINERIFTSKLVLKSLSPSAYSSYEPAAELQ